MKKLSLLAVAGALAAIATPSHAAELFTFGGALASDPVVSIAWTQNGQNYSENAYAGLYSVTLGSGASAITTNVFCVDPSHSISSGNQDQATLSMFTNTTNGFGTATYNNVGNTGTNANLHTAQQNANAIAYLIHSYLNNVSLNPTQSAEVNVAIWAISYDGGADPGNANSNFQASGGGISDANVMSYINAAYANANNSYTSNVVWIDNKTSSSYQDFGLNGGLDASGNYNTPEPGLVQMASVTGLTLGGGLLRRRRRFFGKKS
jgi:hypothetical protein